MLLIMQINKRETMNVLCLQACGLAPKMGCTRSSTRSSIVVARWESVCNLQQNVLFLIKSNSKCLS